MSDLKWNVSSKFICLIAYLYLREICLVVRLPVSMLTMIYDVLTVQMWYWKHHLKVTKKKLQTKLMNLCHHKHK
jgi:hypothetical protein